MSSKKKKKNIHIVTSPTIAKDESYTDFICPICLQILIEPVQMPCQHELCMQCFKMHVENTSLQCPMCRLRISTWHRRHNKTNTLINMNRWDLIKELFPERVQRRLNGEDDFESSYSEYNAPKHVIATEGELRKEYEDELKKLQEEQAAVTEANVEYIKQLEAEEAEARKKQEEVDEAQAKALQEEEMRNLGVTLKSPTSHQRQLLALYKPKSPMKLRGNRAVLKGSIEEKHKRKIDLSSPNRTITNFFEKRTLSTPSCSSKNSSDQQTDLELARRLQMQYDKELDLKPVTVVKRNSKQPLRRKNNSSPVYTPMANEEKYSSSTLSKRQKQENINPV